MTSSIIISIIVPTFNRGHLIQKTLLSLLAQSDKRYEIIIVDDGSTDNTEEIVKGYLSDRVSYFKKENAERAAARNYGTSKAQGQYVNWFDSDDLALENHVATAITMIEKYNNPEVFALGYAMQDEKGNLLQKYTYSLEVMNSQIHKGNYLACNPVFVRKDIAQENPFNEDRLLSASEDYELWMRLAAKYPIFTDNVVSFHIVHHEERSVLMTDPKKLIDRFEKFIYYTTLNQSVSHFLGKNYNYFVMKNYLILAADLAAIGYNKEAWNYLKKSVDHSKRIFFERSFYATLKHIMSL